MGRWNVSGPLTCPSRGIEHALIKLSLVCRWLVACVSEKSADSYLAEEDCCPLSLIDVAYPISFVFRLMG